MLTQDQLNVLYRDELDCPLTELAVEMFGVDNEGPDKDAELVEHAVRAIKALKQTLGGVVHKDLVDRIVREA